MDMLTWFLVALPVASMVLLAGCGLLDMAEQSIRALWRRVQQARERSQPAKRTRRVTLRE